MVISIQGDRHDQSEERTRKHPPSKNPDARGKSALGNYDRSTGLQRLLGKSDKIRPEDALRELLPLEQDCETRRQTGRIAYSVARHLEVMVAIIAEASLLPEFKPRDIPQG